MTFMWQEPYADGGCAVTGYRLFMRMPSDGQFYDVSAPGKPDCALDTDVREVTVTRDANPNANDCTDAPRQLVSVRKSVRNAASYNSNLTRLQQCYNTIPTVFLQCLNNGVITDYNGNKQVTV